MAHPHQSEQTSQLDDSINYFVSPTGIGEDLLVDGNIFLHIAKVEPKSDPSGSYNSPSKQQYVVTLYSYRIPFTELHARITEWTQDYRQNIRERNKGEIFHGKTAQ